MRLCAVVGPSSVAMMSLIPSGIPCKGPRSTPDASSASSIAAVLRAVSSKRARYVPSTGSRRSARSIRASVTSRLVISPAWMAADRSVSVT
jgi:hypothetical protein